MAGSGASAARTSAQAEVVDLFSWKGKAEADRWAAYRRSLINQIEAAKPRSHRRIVLEQKLKDATLAQLKVETASDRG